MYDVLKIGYVQTTAEALTYIDKIFDRELVLILTEFKFYYKSGGKLYNIMTGKEVV